MSITKRIEKQIKEMEDHLEENDLSESKENYLSGRISGMRHAFNIVIAQEVEEFNKLEK